MERDDGMDGGTLLEDLRRLVELLGGGDPGSDPRWGRLRDRATDLGFRVDVRWPMPVDGPAVAVTDVLGREILVSSSLSTEEKVRALAHEVGHAEQVVDGSDSMFYHGSPFSLGCRDPGSWYLGEADACDRAERLGAELGLGVPVADWRADRDLNLRLHSEQLGLEHLGRS